MNPLYLATAMLICFANDNDALVPELWANEGLAILEEKMVMAGLVHRSFESEIREFGDVVNTRRPGTRTGRRRTDTDTYDHADVSLTNVRVPLDQWFYDSFVIRDGESSKAFQELIPIHLAPAMQNIARMVDRALCGRLAHALRKTPTTRSGRLGSMTGSNARDFVLDAREQMNVAKAYTEGRNLVLAPSSETALLKTDLFVAANQRGDGGAALENARLGKILGFDTFMGQNVNSLSTTSVDTVAGTITNALAAGGSGSQACSIASYEAIVGEYVTVAGNDQPTYLTARTASTNTTAITLDEANKNATLAGAVVTVYKSCVVKGGFASGYSKYVTVDGHTASKGPQVGQLISFGTGGSRHTYTIIEAVSVSSTETNLLLDRPLDAALTDEDAAFPGPAGSFNLAFHKDAIALVSRPLAIPPSRFGVAAAVGTYNGVSMRVVMQYDSSLGGTRVNLDVLAGIAILDEDLGCLLLG